MALDISSEKKKTNVSTV